MRRPTHRATVDVGEAEIMELLRAMLKAKYGSLEKAAKRRGVSRQRISAILRTARTPPQWLLDEFRVTRKVIYACQVRHLPPPPAPVSNSEGEPHNSTLTHSESTV